MTMFCLSLSEIDNGVRSFLNNDKKIMQRLIWIDIYRIIKNIDVTNK